MAKLKTYNDFVNESRLLDQLKNKFRRSKNENVLAEEIFKKLKHKLKQRVSLYINMYIQTTSEETGDRKMLIEIDGIEFTIETLNLNDLENFGEISVKALDKRKKQKPITLKIDYDRADYYISYFERKKIKNINKAKKHKKKEDVDHLLDII